MTFANTLGYLQTYWFFKCPVTYIPNFNWQAGDGHFYFLSMLFQNFFVVKQPVTV